MRKETILNYEKEFLAWCKGESILLGAPASMHEKPLVWREVRDFNDWKPLDTVYVLNDSYSTYRKALAEGKSIQMLCRYDKMEPIWDDMTEVIKSIGFVDVKENYRIKPEEPKFKIGDWVRDLRDNSVFQINSVNFNLNLSITNGVYIHWQPKPGEWCWFYQNKREIPTLGNLKHFSDKDSFCAYSTPKASMSVKYFKHCEPFIGQLPTSLQDIK